MFTSPIYNNYTFNQFWLHVYKNKNKLWKRKQGESQNTWNVWLGLFNCETITEVKPCGHSCCKKKMFKNARQTQCCKNVRAVTFSTLLLVTDNTTNISSAESYKWQCTSFPNLYKRFRHTLYNKDVRTRLFVSDYRLRN